MAVIDHIDGPNRKVYLHSDTVNADLQPMDIYTEMRTLRRLNEELRKYDVFMSGEGRVPKIPGKYTERFVILKDGTRIIPYDMSGNIKVIGTIITDDGLEGTDCFERTTLSPGVDVDIDYVPPQVEVIVIEQGVSGLTAEESNALLQNTSDLSAIATDISAIENNIATLTLDVGLIEAGISTIVLDIATIQIDISQIKDDIILINTNIGTISLDVSGMQVDLAFMKAIEAGEWKIEMNQLICYDQNSVEMMRFDLMDEYGNPSMMNVFRRVPV